MKVSLICIWFGKLPSWFDFFCHSCSTDKRFEWIIYTDSTKKVKAINNVILKPMTMEEFSKLASGKLDMSYRLPHGYKLCDWKVAYGYLFKEDIKNSDWFGWCDIDVIYGNFKKYLPNKVLKEYDIITCSPKRDKFGGVFSILKNNKVNRELFMRCDYKKIFNRPNYSQFDHFAMRDICINFENNGAKILWSHLPDTGDGERHYGADSMIMMNARSQQGGSFPATWHNGTVMIEPSIETFILHGKFLKHHIKWETYGQKFHIEGRQ